MKDIQTIQTEIAEWAARNFPEEGGESIWTLLGLNEEVGELNKAHLKEFRQIRGSSDEWEEATQDAVADILIYLCDYSSRRGWDLLTLLNETWDDVQKRDWINHPEDGGVGLSSLSK